MCKPPACLQPWCSMAWDPGPPMIQSLVVIAHWAHRDTVTPTQPPPRVDLHEPQEFWGRTHGRSKDLGLYRLLGRDPSQRTKILLTTLSFISSWPSNTSILLVSNTHIPEAEGYVSKQIVVEQPKCSLGKKGYSHKWCLPWEALRALCSHGNDKPCNEGSGSLAASPQLLKYDVFVYLEDDILISGDAFEFWRIHADDMYRRGFFLVPHCHVNFNGTRYLDPWDFPCESVKSFQLRPSFGDQKPQTFFHFPLMNGRGFLMTKIQFSDYIQSGDWDWSQSYPPDKFWGMREGAYMAPLQRRWSHSVDSVVSHQRLAVLHGDADHYSKLPHLATRSNRFPKCTTSGMEKHLGLRSVYPWSITEGLLHLQKSFLAMVKQNIDLGCQDARALLHLLKPSFERGGRRGIFIDVGGNNGDLSEAIMKTFEPWSVGIPSSSIPMVCGDCMGQGRQAIKIYALEPEPTWFRVLQKRIGKLRSLSTESKIVAMQMAVSDVPGYQELYSNGVEDSAASLHIKNAEQAKQNSWVKVISLDSQFLPLNRPVHFVNIDVEGSDLAVLRGARELLRLGRIRFIVFEFGDAWQKVEPKISFRAAVEYLFSFGYLCFLITRLALIPLNGPLWDSFYESLPWANTFCARSDDVFDVYVAYGTNNQTRHFAQVFLWYGGATESFKLFKPVQLQCPWDGLI